VVLPLPKLKVASTEIAAYARQAWLMRYDDAPLLPDEAQQGDDVVVCLHGLFANGGVLRPLRARLELHEGIHTASMSYPVGPGVKVLARQLRELLCELPDGVRIHLVGHSLGGVVARYFVQQLGDPRVIQTISMATPFAGVRRADWLRVAIGKDLAPSSPLLRQLRLSSLRRLALPHLSLIADRDSILSAPRAHALPRGDVAVVHNCGHNALLFHHEAASIIERRVLSLAHMRLRAG